MMLATMLVELNRPPQWFANLVIYALYLAMFGYFTYNIVQGFRMAKKQRELEEFKKRLEEVERVERIQEHFRKHKR